MLKIDPFLERNQVLFQGNDKHTTGTSFWSGRFMFPNSSAGAIVPVGTAPLALPLASESERQATIRELMPYFLGYGKVELRWASGTLEKYEDAMGWVIRWLGEIPPGRITQQHILLIKAECAKRNVGPSRIAHILAALKAFLRFCQLGAGIETMDVRQIHFPRIPKREVQFLTPDEIQQYVAAIPIRTGPRSFDMKWLCFRALVEVLLGTGMRISEALSLKRSSINFQTGEATIIGKGNKERVVFFSPRSLNWVKEYVTRRKDHGEALFTAVRDGKALARETSHTWFRRFRRSIRFPKPVTAHMLRHTVATTLLFNGCPIGHIKEILGHDRLITTCNFYLGADKRAAKKAHGDFLDYERGE
jgi:integrase/recombinase XerC